MPTLNAATERGDMFRSLLLSCTLFVLLAGCGLNLGGVSVEFDEALEEELRTLVRADGAMKPLVELLPGDSRLLHFVASWAGATVADGAAT